jgi:hypothetical protein
MTVEERLAVLEQRLRRAEDELAIARLMASYGPLADAGDADAVAGLWAEDGDAAPLPALTSCGGQVVAGQAKCSGQPLRARRERHLDASTGRDDVAFLDIRAAVASPHRLAL